MRDLLSKLGISLIPLILGALIGIYTKAWQDKQQVQTQYLDKDVSIRNVIGQLSISGRKLDILLDSKPIENLSQVYIRLYNATDQPYENIPVYIDIMPVEGDSLEIISKDVAGANGLREAVTGEPNVLSPNTAGSVHLGYLVKTANPSREEPIFTANYIVLGKKSPAIANLAIDKKGLATRQFSFSNFYKTPWYASEIFLISAFIIFYSVGGYILSRYLRRAGARQMEKYKAYLKENLTEKITELGDKPDPAAVVEAVSKISDKYKWENTSAFLRRFMGLKQPG